MSDLEHVAAGLRVLWPVAMRVGKRDIRVRVGGGLRSVPSGWESVGVDGEGWWFYFPVDGRVSDFVGGLSHLIDYGDFSVDSGVVVVDGRSWIADIDRVSLEAAGWGLGKTPYQYIYHMRWGDHE